MLASLAQALLPALLIALSFPGTTQGDIAWYSAAYSLTSATFVLPSGRLGDLFGHRGVFVIGYVWFALWSLLAGIAPYSSSGGTAYFCFARAMQGVGPALLVPNGLAMLGRAYAGEGMMKRKRVVMCLFGACAPMGFVVGGIMSCLVADGGRWWWGFWILAAVCVVLAVGSWAVLPRREGGRKGENGRIWTRLDGNGMLLGVTGLVLFNFSFTQAPQAGWTTPYIYFLLILGALFIIAFVWYERAMATYPLIPISAMTAQTTFVLACTATGWASFSIWIYYTVYLLENLRGWSPLPTSVSLAPAPVTGLTASLLAGWLMGKVGAHWVMLISMGAFFVGSLLMATAPVRQMYWGNTFWAILIMPFVSASVFSTLSSHERMAKGAERGWYLKCCCCCCCASCCYPFYPSRGGRYLCNKHTSVTSLQDSLNAFGAFFFRCSGGLSRCVRGPP
ncbi:major facilitator superfamily domain-containing protein [Cercophora newfieldiana]|uniref:Major facilitator superfamily domain-containing protein n=1 Tax=Cercophora newfieldiana TaxID=92897 RepID=A0AA39YBE1_9PEZI|nr:major facilitator superfamily domain-containing protein [Cercophora newfieldiana]